MIKDYQDFIAGGLVATALYSPHGVTRALAELARIEARHAYELAKWGYRHFPKKAAMEIAARTAKSTGKKALARGVSVATGPVGISIGASVIASALIQNQIRQASPDKQTLLVAAYTGQHAGLPPQPLGVMM